MLLTSLITVFKRLQLMLPKMLSTLISGSPFTLPLAAATLHVSPSGDDGAAGSATAPLKALTIARDQLRAGKDKASD